MFLHVEPTETVLELKAKIQLATDGDDCPGGFPPRTQKLLVGPGWHSAMEDGMQLQELKVENDMEIALVLLRKVDPPDGSPEGTEPTEEWEEVRIEEPGASEPAACAGHDNDTSFTNPTHLMILSMIHGPRVALEYPGPFNLVLPDSGPPVFRRSKEAACRLSLAVIRGLAPG